jgi:pimeloyl-ACP methyl ester carboxylesterase
MGVKFLDRAGGRLAYEVHGTGRLVVCSPGLGDLRGTFDTVVDPLVSAGYRVALADLRGHGESSIGWDSYLEAEIADDLLALAAELDDAPAVLIGNSYSAGAAVVAAAGSPDRVAGLVLTGPFVRDQPTGVVDQLTRGLLMLPGLGWRLWVGYWPKLFGSKPADFDARRRALAENLAESGRFAAVASMARADHKAAQRALADVRCPALIVMGDADPDFPDPAAEAQYIADTLGGPATVTMLAGVGHYPQAESPAVVASAVVKFIEYLDPLSCPE